MKTCTIEVVGLKKFQSKKGDEYCIVYYISSAFEKGVEGSQAGYFFLNDDFEPEIDKNYTALLGYDRAGKFGVIGIVNY